MRGVSEWSVNRVVALVLNDGLLGLQPSFGHLLRNDLRCELRLRQRIWPGIANHGLSHEPVFIACDDFERCRRWMPARACDAHLIGTDLLHVQRRHIGIDIGSQVMRRIMHLVEQLLAQRVKADAPARPRRFADNGLAIFPHLGDGIADVRQVGDGAPVSTEVAAAGLGAAFEQMADDDALGEPVPIVPAPSQFIDQWCEEERGIGNSTRQDDIRARVQCLDQRPCP